MRYLMECRHTAFEIHQLRMPQQIELPLESMYGTKPLVEMTSGGGNGSLS